MSHFRRGWFALLCVLAPVAGGAEAKKISNFRLENGLDVVVIEDHRAPVVVHMLWYRAGSADEIPGSSGVAHFLEHLLFKKTKLLASGEFSRIVAENGGSDNAFTSADYTAYFQRVASDRLPLMMQLEADRMVNLQLDEADIVTERDVIIEERNQRTESSPGALFSEQRMAAQYLQHPYGRPIIGWRHEMERLGLQDALRYYRQFYAPNNAVLIVAGDVDPARVKQLAQDTYGKIAPNPDLQNRQRVKEPPQTAARRLVFYDQRVAQPYVIRTYLAPERNSGAQRSAAALKLLSDLLGGGQTSWFSQKLQFETQTAVYTSAFYGGTSLDQTTFGLVIVPSEGVGLEEAEAALDKAVADFIDQGIDIEQLERLKKQFRAAEIYAQDSVQGLANAYGRALTSGLTLEDIRAWPDIVQSIQPEEILAAARKVFDKRKSVTGWLIKAEETMQ